jgi:hypothetical protein
MYYIAYTCNIGYVTFVMMMEDTARHKMEGSNTMLPWKEGLFAYFLLTLSQL